MKPFWATFTDVWRFLSGHTAPMGVRKRNLWRILIASLTQLHIVGKLASLTMNKVACLMNASTDVLAMPDS